MSKLMKKSDYIDNFISLFSEKTLHKSNIRMKKIFRCNLLCHFCSTSNHLRPLVNALLPFLLPLAGISTIR
ncbi:hypothetical protein Patl1_22695 [Pistacia atlantica]|uniref:Uncharacterized protein n=1 Tax=Pistacia atlantica TaxID=434234 RepID=A0ACC1A025_9ROSI|nr:hypothetical protein Patl1_22695 [Pistacia atlantica]